MTEKNRPEWFEIAESDGESKPVRTRRSLPVAAIVAAALVIGIGAVVAQTQEEPPASATEMTSVTNDQAVASQTPSASASATPTSNAVANPNITKLPTGQDEDGNREGREHHGDRQMHGDGDRPPHPEGDDD